MNEFENITLKTKETLNAIGAIAELAATFRIALIRQRVPKDEVREYVKSFVRDMIYGSKNLD